MNLSDLLQTHIKDIDAATRDATKPTRNAADLGRPAGLFEARIKRVDARIELLEEQRAATEKRLVAAIEDQKRLRDEMEKEAKVWAGRNPTKPNEPPPGRGTATGPGTIKGGKPAAKKKVRPGKPQ